MLRPVVYRNVIYLTASAQREHMGAELYWAKKRTADDNSGPPGKREKNQK